MPPPYPTLIYRRVNPGSRRDTDILNADSNYPQPGVIACEITKSWQGADGREIVSIDTASPWAVEAVTGETDFDVLREQIIEFQ
jgi:hypothetical protein